MANKLKPLQDLSPGFPGNLDIMVEEVSGDFVTVRTTIPNALTHDVLWKEGFKYIGPIYQQPDYHNFWFMTYQRHY